MGKVGDIIINGVKYRTVADACKHLGITVNGVYTYRRNHGCTTLEAISGELIRRNTEPEMYEAFGKKYLSIAAAARDYDLSGDMVRSIMRGTDKTLEEAIKISQVRQEFNDKCIELGINPYSARSTMRAYGLTRSEALESLNIAASYKAEHNL